MDAEIALALGEHRLVLDVVALGVHPDGVGHVPGVQHRKLQQARGATIPAYAQRQTWSAGFIVYRL